MDVRVLAASLVLVAGCSSSGPRIPSEELRGVPSIVGEVVADARAVLESEGFTVLVVPEDQTPDPNDLDGSPEAICAGGTVTSQDPSDDERVLAAATVAIYASGCP